jgi:hypothetical protein
MVLHLATVRQLHVGRLHTVGDPLARITTVVAIAT